jgi:hypothetical protein
LGRQADGNRDRQRTQLLHRIQQRPVVERLPGLPRRHQRRRAASVWSPRPDAAAGVEHAHAVYYAPLLVHTLGTGRFRTVTGGDLTRLRAYAIHTAAHSSWWSST